MTLPDNYEPAPAARAWYRCAQTGQLGWFVKRDGQPKFKYDRPGSREILKPFNKTNFIPCDDIRKLTEYHIAQITFEADKVLCKILGKYEQAQKDWSLLKNQQRVDWMTLGPRDDCVERKMLYTTVKYVMSKIDEKNSTKSDPK